MNLKHLPIIAIIFSLSYTTQASLYDPPNDFQFAQPGTILRHRPVPENVTSPFNASSSAYQIMFRTTNSRYQPAWAVTTVFIPINPGKELLSYQIPYNTADPNASPSQLLYSGQISSGLVLTDINNALNNGWYVNVPDFEGPTASFTSGVQEGHAVLDSVRAVLSKHDIERYAMWGYSGGSIASEWAAELQVQYAPELNFSGMAIGGLVPNLTSIYDAVDGTPAAWLIPTSLVGLTNQFPDFYNLLLEALKHQNESKFLSTQNLSLFDSMPVYENEQIFDDYFTDGRSFLSKIQPLLNTDGTMGYHGVPQMPVFLYKAIHDEYSPIADSDKLVDRYCEVGANILYERNEAGNHLDEYTNGDARALKWLKTVIMDDKSDMLTQGCVIRNVDVNITSHSPFAPP